MYGYIYIITCYDGTKYIGQHKSKNIDDRYLGSGKIIKDKLKSHSRDQFKKDILCICDSQESLDKWEKYWIAECDAVNNPIFLNIQTGGQDSSLSTELRSELAKNAYEAHPESADKISESIKAKWQDPEFRERHAKAMKEYYETEKGKADLKKMQEAHIKKMLDKNCDDVKSDSKSKRPRKKNTESHEEHMKALRAGYDEAMKDPEKKKQRYLKTSRKVICIETGRIFDSIRECSKEMNIPEGTLACHLTGRKKSCHGFHFQYWNESEVMPNESR